MGFHARSIDDDPPLLEQSYRLRYQVYCVEREFLPAGDYPDKLETDSFDAASIHVAAIDDNGQVAATARIVKPNSVGLPLFRYCTVFPLVTPLDEPGHMAVEISRVSISRQYARRPGDVLLGGIVVPGSDPGAPVVGGHERRRRSGEPFLTLLKAIVAGAREAGATHLIFAVERALHRWLAHYGFPCRLSGPEAEYYGRVAPYIMSLAELDEVILGGHFAALNDFPIGVAAGPASAVQDQ
jgi:N-acyl amino acid synthase of PEP-CTERM/exosortase system